MPDDPPKRLGPIYIGCAGWAIPKEYAGRFPTEGTHLTRYANRLPAVEINSSFYRPHRPATYARWADSVPDDFRFAVKVPRAATHERRLADAGDVLDRFLSEVIHLGERLGPLLVQLPPSLPFNVVVAGSFFESLRAQFTGAVVVEPRHPTWFEPPAGRLVAKFRVARAAADPAVVRAAAEPGGWGGPVYYRLHGSPKMYYSAYSADDLERLAGTLENAARSAPVWCIFDNTAEGAAMANALALRDRLGPEHIDFDVPGLADVNARTT